MWNDRFSNASSHCLLCCFVISFLSSKDSRIAFCTCRINGFCDLVSVDELPSVTQIYSRCFKSNTSYEYSMLVRRHCVIVLKQNVLRVGEAEENRCFSSASPFAPNGSGSPCRSGFDHTQDLLYGFLSECQSLIIHDHTRHTHNLILVFQAFEMVNVIDLCGNIGILSGNSLGRLYQIGM